MTGRTNKSLIAAANDQAKARQEAYTPRPRRSHDHITTIDQISVKKLNTATTTTNNIDQARQEAIVLHEIDRPRTTLRYEVDKRDRQAHRINGIIIAKLKSSW